jgi:hypothetical protein
MNPSTQTHARDYLGEQISIFLESKGFETTATPIPQSPEGSKVVAEKGMIKLVIEAIYDHRKTLFYLHIFDIKLVKQGKTYEDFTGPTMIIKLFRGLFNSQVVINRPLDVINILERYNDLAHTDFNGIPLWPPK